MRILILKPSSLGDVIHAIPVLRLLKKHRPESQVHWWIESQLAPLLEQDSDLSGLVHFNRKRWTAPHRWPELFASIREIRRKQFDLTIDLQGLARSALCGWAANAGLSIGLDNPREGAREGARGFYDLVAPRAKPGTHAVDRYLAILSLLDIPISSGFDWLPVRPEVASNLEKKWHPRPARWVMLLPGARWENKRWPLEHFVDLVKQMRSEPDLRIGILGGAGDRDLGKAISEAAPKQCLDLTGKTTLLEMIEWIRLSELTISNDTGPMHVAAALRKKVIAIFGPTDPNSTGPYGQLGNVVQVSSLACVPCLKGRCQYREPMACLQRVTPSMVWQKAQSLLAATR